ncbi:site-specific DNA-cytosine methylase [Sinorhizobium fredii]|uniref:DNA cytosine methyltransferase n=1 Tax=Rhizobium fredii TaxID=380 RepID=UPI0035160394
MYFVELFAGAGGMGLGLEAAGMEHLLSFEKEEAQHSVLMHAGKDAVRMDLKDIATACFAMRERPDLIAGGPPCQDFSRAGKRQKTERARLTQHFAQIICLMRIEWFVFENVPEAAKSSEYRWARALWKRHGYGLTEVQLDAQDYGVPQRRRRHFCIGRLNEIDGFLFDDLMAAASPKSMTIRDMLDPRKFPEDRALLEKGCYFARPWMGKSDEPNGRGILSIDEPCATIARNTHEYPGEGYVAHPNDAGKLKDAHILTPAQVARIQGFPSKYDFRRKERPRAREGWPDKTINLMVANAVPAPMMQRIGKVIFERHHCIEWTKETKASGMPKLDRSFAAHLKEQRPHLYRADFKRIQADADRARKLIGDHSYMDTAAALKALKNSSEKGVAFSKLPKKEKSALIKALTEHRKYEYNQFNAFISRRRPDLTKAAIYNVRSNVNRARRMIDGRIYATSALEVQALEDSIENGVRFRDMPFRLQSDLRQALADYRAFIEETWSPSVWAPKPARMPMFGHGPQRKPRKLRTRKKGTALLQTTPRRILEAPLNLNRSKEEDKPDALVKIFDAEFFHLDALPEPRYRVSDEEEWRPDDYWIPDPEELEPED